MSYILWFVIFSNGVAVSNAVYDNRALCEAAMMELIDHYKRNNYAIHVTCTAQGL